mmetsp:Transcript_10414/g.10872  ORF Transcript_10414/g.10872 Transcript_10414/m.10872 type:complete len:133 (+) Transcript_10414:541-939(+)
MISSSLNMFKRPETVDRTLEKIAHGHFNKGVKAYQYPIAGKSLFLTFQYCLGPAWDPATERAWHRIFSHILNVLVKTAVIDEKAGAVVETVRVESKPPANEGVSQSVSVTVATQRQEASTTGKSNVEVITES